MGALISTGDVKDWLGMPAGTADTDSNTRIENIIYAVEDFANGYTMRNLAVKMYTAPDENCYLDGNGLDYIYLPQYPISSIRGSVYVDSDREWDSAAIVASDDLVIYWKTGKVRSEAGYFSKGHRNVYIGTYTAGYAPVKGGTHDSTVGTYPVPNDLKQVLIEMAAQVYKDGSTMIRAFAGAERTTFLNLITQNSLWKQVLDRETSVSASLAGYWE